jgi:hypothetical protein
MNMYWLNDTVAILSLIWDYIKPVLASTWKIAPITVTSCNEQTRQRIEFFDWSSSSPCVQWTMASTTKAVSRFFVPCRHFGLSLFLPYLRVHVLNRTFCLTSSHGFDCAGARRERWGGLVGEPSTRLDTDARSSTCSGGSARGDAAAVVADRSWARGPAAVGVQDRVVGGLLLEVFVPPV